VSPVAPPTVVVPLAVVVPLGAAAVLAAADRHLPGPARDVLGTGAAVATTVLAAVALAESAHQRIVYWFGGWHPVHSTAIGVDYAVDALGGALAVLAGVLALAALVYSRRFFGPSGGRYPALVLVFLAASIDFAWTGDLFNMFVAFELVAVTGFILTGYYAEREAPLQGSINFAVTNTIGGLLMLTGVVLLYAGTGSLNLAQVGQTLSGRPAGGLVAVTFALLATGFLVKAAVVPWHFWLPDAYGAAPAPVCVLLAGVMSELGIFGLARAWETVFAGAFDASAEHRIRLVLGALGVLTALVATAMSLVERHPRRLMAFVVVAHMGLYLLGFSLLRTGALGGMALLAVGDGLTKAAMFLALGVLGRHRRATGGRPLRGDGPGLAVAAGVVVVGALALADLPPFASSVGKDLLVASAGAAGSLVAVVFAVTVIGSSAAVLAATARAWRGETAEQLAPAEATAETPAGSASFLLLAPPVLLLAAALGLGLIPHLADHAVSATASFADRRGYDAAVLNARRIGVTLPPVPATTLSARLGDLAETAGALSIAVLVLGRTRIQSWLVAATGGLRRLHSGHVGDQVTWAVVGLAGLAGLSGLALR
jgi:multicomponent Na+:H+ antiporter subunit D